LDELIEGIRRLMLGSTTEPVRKGLNRRKPAIAAGKMQQQRGGGADG